jgi:nitroreductase
MERMLFAIVILMAAIPGVYSQDIQLPEPVKTGGMPLMEALANRHSTREFTNDTIQLQTMSDLLWAAWGINRRNGKRTAPSAMNRQEIDVYVATPEALYLYHAMANRLKRILTGDIRALCGLQPYVATAPLNLIYVADLDRLQVIENFDDAPSDTYANCGFIAQNVYLFCASKKLGCVVRSSIDKESLGKKMKLRPHQKILLGQTIGYPGTEEE